jgi:hypothetical protein
MYKSAGQAGGQPGGETGGPAGDGHAPGGESKPKEKDNVVDAEFVDVDDKK